jgi:hypothetical protein
MTAQLGKCRSTWECPGIDQSRSSACNHFLTVSTVEGLEPQATAWPGGVVLVRVGTIMAFSTHERT